MKMPNTCVHFTGIQRKQCAVGIAYADVRDASQPGPYRWPCLELAGKLATTTCDKKRLPTVAEVEADMTMVEKAFAAINAGRSPCCDAPLDLSQVVRGTGPRFCSACKKFVMHACAAREVPEWDEEVW